MQSLPPEYTLLALTALGALILFGIKLITAKLRDMQEAISRMSTVQTRMETLLTGPMGGSGVVGQIDALTDLQQVLDKDVAALYIHLNIDRRSGHDRRREVAG